MSENPNDGRAGEAGVPVPAQDGYRRLIRQVGTRAGAAGWMAHGACRDADPELFFPFAAPGTAVEKVQVNQAKAVCGRCEVGRQCLSYALRAKPDGIWGGTTRDERVGLGARAGAHSPSPAAR